MKTKYHFILIVMTVTFFVSSAGLANGDKDLQVVVKGNDSFAFDLYQELKAREGNLFFSPYSISTAMAMTYAGARG